MQLPEQPPPPLASLWDRVLRARTLPPDLDVQQLYVAIRDRLTHPEWEVRLHALRVLADLLPLSGNALTFPFDQVVDNLGHSSPNVRKAALDALKVFCSYCEDPECAARAILDKCSYQNIRPHSADFDSKANVLTGLILSVPSVLGILKRRNTKLDIFPMFEILCEKLFDPLHRDVALRSMIKLRRVCGPRDYMMHLSQLDPNVQDKFRQLCTMYDEDSHDVYYAPRKSSYRESSNGQVVKANFVTNTTSGPRVISTDSSSDDYYSRVPYYRNNFGKIIIETEIKFDSDTAITMTVLEENETESDRNIVSEDDDSSDQTALKYSDGDDGDSDTDVVVKKVRFGGESVKIRTPDSENQVTSEDDNKSGSGSGGEKEDNIEEVTATVTPVIVNKMNEIKSEALERENRTANVKKSGIPLPVIQSRNRSKVQSVPLSTNRRQIKQKSKSLNELYDFFQAKNGMSGMKRDSGFALTLVDVKSPEKVPSPIEPHREVEVFHNLQRSPVLSPRRRSRIVQWDSSGFIANIQNDEEPSLLSPRGISPIRAHYDWEDLDVVPQHIVDQLHNQENWISAVKAADQLHSALLDAQNVKRVEPAAVTLVQHMWALSNAVPAAKSPAEGAVCAVFRAASSECARQLLPTLVSRMAKEPPPAALPHALLQRLALHHLVDLIFDQTMIGISGDLERLQAGQLQATLCLARAAGPAAVLSAVRRRLAGTARADSFCQKLRGLLNRPMKTTKANHISRSSQLPVPVRRRARSTPPPAGPLPPRRLRPLPDSAPLPGISQQGRNLLKPLSQISLRDGDSSATTASIDRDIKLKTDDDISYKSTIGETTEVDVTDGNIEEVSLPRSPSIRVEDFSARTIEAEDASPKEVEMQQSIAREMQEPEGAKSLEHYETKAFGEAESLFGSQNSLNSEAEPQCQSPIKRSPSRKSSPSPTTVDRSAHSSPSKSRVERSAHSSLSQSRVTTPSPVPFSEPHDKRGSGGERDVRDVRTALSECLVPPRHEDWEVIENGLVEMERLAVDASARAPAAAWRAAARSSSAHVRSLRSRVARAACSALGSLFEHRGRALEPELEEATVALLERCADVNRFLRADAAAALVRVACGGGGCARAAVALCRRGCAHRAGPVRAAAAAALARLVAHRGAARVLDLPPEPRAVLLRAAGELLGDAHADTRSHARDLCLALAEDERFKPLLKESMPVSRYRAVEKHVDKLRCR